MHTKTDNEYMYIYRHKQHGKWHIFNLETLLKVCTFSCTITTEYATGTLHAWTMNELIHPFKKK